jgi:hypothetical protein
LVTFRNNISFDFKYFSAFVPLVSNNSFVFSYFLASFRLASCVFNNILASIVLFLYFLQIPACPFRRRRSALPAPPGIELSLCGESSRLTIGIGYHARIGLSSEKCKKAREVALRAGEGIC